MLNYNYPQELYDEVAHKIAARFSVSLSEAKELAKDLIEQLDAHGGSPLNEKQMDISIDSVIPKWLKLKREQQL